MDNQNESQNYQVQETETKVEETKEKKYKKGGIKTGYSELLEDEDVLVEESDPISEEDQKLLANQVEKEYQYGKVYAEPKLAEDLRRLKLYNNQRRDPSKVGDTLLFTIHQTVLSALTEDRLSVEWAAKELGDSDTSENLNQLAEYDYQVMEKDAVDYDWNWNTLFFGRALLEFNTFSRENQLTPIPQVWDMTMVVRDPRATSVNGDKLGNGAARFLGLEIAMTMKSMKDNPAFFNLDKLKNYKAGSKANTNDGDYRNLMYEAREARAEAGNMQEYYGLTGEADLGDNREYELL